MATRLDDELSERFGALALDVTLQVPAGATIGAHTLLADTPVETNLVASKLGTGEIERAQSASPAHSLPRISLGAGAPENAANAIGAAQPDLRLEGVLGEGGMGRVHLASQRSLRRQVAVKILKEGASRDAHEALLSEARVTGFLAHPGIIPVHSLGLDDQLRPVLVMKRIEGVPWRDMLHDPNSQAWSYWDSRVGDRLEAHLEILAQVCDAVHFAHSQGVIHRDIKPENIMLGTFGEVYLVDWGLAVHAGSEALGQLVGTPAYMPPEMALGQAVDARTDVYALGATLHEVLTGEYLHQGKTLHELLAKSIRSEAFDYAESLPLELVSLCHRATAKDPHDRPPSAGDFRKEISDYLAHRGSIAVSDAAQLRLQESERALADATMGPQERAFALGTHCAEARFGFEQALKAWPQNQVASAGLHSCFELLVEAQLLRRDLVGAQAQLQAIEHPPEHLAVRVAALATELEHERVEHERLHQLDKELDKSTGVRERVLAFVVICCVAIGTCLVLLISGWGSKISNADSVALVCVFLLIAAVVVGLKRKKLLSNAFNRRTVAAVFVAFFAMLLNRLLAWHLAIAIDQVLLNDMILLATCTALIGALLNRWSLWMVPSLVAGAVTMALAPLIARPLYFSLFSCLALLSGGIAWYRQSRRDSAA